MLERVDPLQELHFIEVGSFEGRSSVWFADNYLHHPLSTITCIDTWQGGEEVQRLNLPFDFKTIESNFLHNIQQSKYPDKFVVHKESSLTRLRIMVGQGRRYNFIYLDGSHVAQDVFYDLTLSFLLLKPLGIILLDDYLNAMFTNDTRLRVKPAVDAFLSIMDNQVKFVRTSSGQAYLVKRP